MINTCKVNIHNYKKATNYYHTSHNYLTENSTQQLKPIVLYNLEPGITTNHCNYSKRKIIFLRALQ